MLNIVLFVMKFSAHFLYFVHLSPLVKHHLRSEPIFPLLLSDYNYDVCFDKNYAEN